MVDDAAQSRCPRYLQQQEGRCINDHAVPVLCIWPWPHHRVSSPSIRELSLWLSTSGMLTRNCRWSRRMSRVRIPSVRSMSCWVSAKDMSWLATPLIWRGRVGGLRAPAPGRASPRNTPLGWDALTAILLVPSQPLQPSPSSRSFTYSVPLFLAASQCDLILCRGNISVVCSTCPEAGAAWTPQTPEAQFSFALGPALSFHALAWCQGVRPQAGSGAGISLSGSSFSQQTVGCCPFCLPQNHLGTSSQQPQVCLDQVCKQRVSLPLFSPLQIL